MSGWRVTVVLASMLVAASATTGYGDYGGHHDSRPHGDHDPRVGPGMSVTAYFEMAGIRGDICFTQSAPGENVTITVKLKGLEQFEGQKITWFIHQFPVRYSEYPDFPCGMRSLGQLLGDPAECIPFVSASGNCIGSLAVRHGSLDPTNETRTFTDNMLTLFGPDSIVGRSIVLRNTNRGSEFSCANIEYQGITLQTLRAEFQGGNLGGEVIFRRQDGRAGTTLQVEVYPSCNETYCPIDTPCPDLDWSLRSGTCSNIGPIFGSDTHADEIHHGAFSTCSAANPRGCPAGDLTTKCGQLQLRLNMYRKFCTDDQLGLLPLSTVESTVLVASLPDGTIIDCAPWKPINQLCARVNCIKRPRIRMDVLFFQRDPVDRTHVRSFITGLDMEKRYLQVRRDPVTDSSECEAGGIYDKPRRALLHHSHVPQDPLKLTGDVLPVGVMECKTTSPKDMNSVVVQDTTSWLPLFGPYSIIGRSLALTDANGVPVACCNIEHVVNPSPELINSILGYQEQSNTG